MKSKFNELSQRYDGEAERLLSDWVKIPSVYDETTIGPLQPFGESVKDALRHIGKIAIADGFRVSLNEGYATEISYGAGPIIGIYAHADVVPVSGTWRYPPFSGIVADGKMYGRGTSDDKGPAVASYLAMKLLKEQGLIGGYQVRLVIGGNEERGSRCLHHYFHEFKKPQAVAGFTPDGQFPLIYGEKGITNYQLSGHADLGPVLKIDAGVVANSVIDNAVAIVRRDATIADALAKSGYRHEITHEGHTTTITLFGKAAHGSVPEFGVNAGLQLLEVLGKHYDLELPTLLAHQYAKPFGENLGLYFETPLLHHTTYNVGLINYDGRVFSMIVNFRHPENVDVAKVIRSLKVQTPLDVKILMSSKPLLIDPHSPFITTLLKAYQDETGDMETPMVTIGGGTYAKEAQNTVAFGSAFPGKDDHIHDADEKIDLEDLHRSIAIYARALSDLGRLYAVKK